MKEVSGDEFAAFIEDFQNDLIFSQSGEVIFYQKTDENQLIAFAHFGAQASKFFIKEECRHD